MNSWMVSEEKEKCLKKNGGELLNSASGDHHDTLMNAQRGTKTQGQRDDPEQVLSRGAETHKAATQ